jgi:hypothetical protein
MILPNFSNEAILQVVDQTVTIESQFKLPVRSTFASEIKRQGSYDVFIKPIKARGFVRVLQSPAYQEYLKRTPSMFIPGDHWLIGPLQAAYRTISVNRKLRIPVLLFVYLLICLVAVKVAYALKHRTVQLLPQTFIEDSLTIALQNADRNRLADLVALAQIDPRVTEPVQRHTRSAVSPAESPADRQPANSILLLGNMRIVAAPVTAKLVPFLCDALNVALHFWPL